MGLEAVPLMLRLFDSLVDSTLSYAAAMWAPGLAAVAAARPVVGGTAPLEPETLHLQFQRQLLGLPASTPTATVLAELGEPPLYVCWLMHAARFWNSLVAALAGSVLQQALETALQLAADCEDLEPAQQPWSAQLAASLQ